MMIPSKFAPVLIVAILCGPVLAFQQPDAPEAAEEARERQVMQRFLAVLEKAPRRGTALDRVYGYHVERGSLEAFIKTYRDRIIADPNDGASWLLIGLVEAQRGRDSAAVEALRKAESTRPDDPLPSYYLGQALVLVGQPDAAAEAFERALTRKPSRADLLDVFQALGRVHQRAHRNDKALAVWDRLEKAFPDDPRVQEQIAHALADESQDAAALTRFEALARATKKDPFRRVQFAIEAAELKVKLGRSPEALADFEGLLGQLDAESWLGREVRRKVEEVFLRTDDLAGLAAYYESWIKKTPDDIEARARLGRALASQGRAAEARKWLDEAVKLAPTRRELRLALIEQLAQERKFAEAAQQYEALAKLEPNNPDVVRDWGRMLLRDVSRPEPDRKKSASEVWRRLAPDDSRDAVAIAQAADLLRQAGLADEAIGLYLRAIKLAPDSAQYREYLGEYYHALKRPADALATWRASAEGKSKNARTLGRLGEVLAGFGYRNEAVAPLTEAIQLEPDDFDLRLKLADLKLALDRPLEALPELEKAEKVASAEEQTEAVLERLIHAYQASGTLAARVEALEKSLATTPTAAGWTRLARLLEAEQKSTEAARAIGEATRLDPKSIPAWVATARLREAAGELLGSADALRILTKLDRRSRTDYLTGIAKLEARLGRRVPALEAGRELLAAAPGNPENHQFFAELCFQLGEPEEGLEALRRSARANPADPKATLTLAENLSRQFRAEEAIELFWRAFARTTDLDGKLAIVGRMADQYLQRNQLDRLIGRLERELREPNQRRELSLCLAQAHSSAGDFGTARLELERLLATDARDAALLTQLSSLAEQEGDVSTAAKYQKQAVEVAPSAEGTARLAGLYDKAGETEEAEAVWSRLAAESDDPSRIFSTVDRLIGYSKNESALAILERMLVKQPGDWQAIYREGVVLEALGKPAEAARRFQAILDLKLADDEQAMSGRPGSKRLGRGVKVALSTTVAIPLENRIDAVESIRLATKLDVDEDSGGGPNPIWTPSDFGEARMSALGWLESLSRREAKPDAVEKAARETLAKAGADPRPRWDWYYFQLIRNDSPATFEAARDLLKAAPSDPSAEYAFLMALSGRTPAEPSGPRKGQGEEADRTPPLSNEDLDRVLACYRDLRIKKTGLAPTFLMDVVRTELIRAKRPDEAEKLYREALAASEDTNAIEAAVDLVAQKGDVAEFLAFHEKSERLRTKAASGISTGASVGHAENFSQLMTKRAEAKAFDDVGRLLDRYLADTRSPEAVARRAKAAGSMASARANYRVRVGGGRRRINLEYPEPNAYYDEGAIQVLLTAHELYKKEDLLTDLTARFKAEVDRLPELEKIYPLLALSYLAWWEDDKDQSVRLLSQAVERANGDVDLRLGLAELLARRGDAADALELVESVDPLDQKTMQRREVMALRLSVLSGDVERARKAAERLFGLRLDADTQVQLAAQMNQLGMHELAEAVLARARRRAGGNTSALVALMLQYQQAGKTETAFQVAHQILRASANRQPSSQYNGNDDDDSARNEAILVFARSGKLKELIDRAEGQLAVAPNSSQVLQTLVEYYKADGQEDKVKETFDRLAKLRPEDARLRFQVAGRMLESGNASGAVENYTFAIKKDPNLFVNNFDEIQAAFQQADQLEGLGKILEELDFKPFSNNPWPVVQIVSSLIEEQKSRELGVKLFRKLWKALPNARTNLMGNLDAESLKLLPELYDYLREAVIPAAGTRTVAGWSSIDHIYSWQGDGKVSSMVSSLLEAAGGQSRIEALAVEVDEALKRSPEWYGGQALRAIILARLGKVDEAKAALEKLLAEDRGMTPHARMVVGQELDGIKPLKDLELKLYRQAVDAGDDMQFQWGPAKRLVTLLHQDGKDAEARELVLKYSRKPETRNYGNNPSYAGYQRVNDALAYGGQMLELGYPADAVRFFEEILGDSEALAGARAVYGGTDQMTQQIVQGLAQAMKGLNPKNLAQTLRTLVPPPAPETSKTRNRPTLAPADLVLIVSPRELDKTALTSLFTEALASAKKAERREVFDELNGVLSKRLEVDRADLSTAIASALVALAEGDADAIARTSGRLVERVQASPLDPIPDDARPNAIQRVKAAEQLGLWLVAREYRKNERTRDLAALLEARALEAAARQGVDHWTLAMLRESGQAAFDRGDRATAEVLWRKMLRQVLAVPGPSRTKKPQTGAGGPSVSTLERFEKAAQIAQLAADHAMPGLSTEAIRDALGAGPPVVPIAMNAAPGGGIPSVEEGGGPAQRVEECIHALDESWSAHQMPARLAYETLRAAVLPDARPDEVFFYPRPLAMGDVERPRSVGAILARRAVEAGQAEDLKKRLEARRDKPLAAVASRVLAVQLAVALKDDASVRALLPDLAERLKREPLKVTAELSCHAAIPALDVNGLEGVALPMVESAMKAMAASGEDDEIGGVITPLVVAIARRKFKANKPDEARATLNAYMERTQQEAIRMGGDYSLYSRKMTLALVAGEFARAGLTTEAWDLLGRFADAPGSRDYGDALDIGPTLGRSIRLLIAMPASERYARLKAWTMPVSGRKSIRLLSTFVPEDRAIPTRFGPMPHVGLDGVASTMGLLIDSAREVGKLDELLLEAKKAADAKIENAQTLLLLASVASGRSSEVNSLVQARLDELKKLKDRKGKSEDNDGQASAVEWRDYLTCRAILADPSTGPQGANFARTLIGLAETHQEWSFLGRIRRDLALHLASKAGKLAESPGADPGLAHWRPVTLLPALAHSRGGMGTLWAESEGIVSHVAGPNAQYLGFDYPLTGKFEVSADTFMGPWAESQLSYAGLIFEVDQSGTVSPVSHHESVNAPTRYIKMGEFNRTTIQVEPGKLRVLVNGHLFHEESDPGSNSPWLAFYSSQERQTAFRGLTITGSPEIPREVRLVQGDRLEGWACGFYQETQPPRRTVGQVVQQRGRRYRGQPTSISVGDLDEYDWHAENGTIVGRREERGPVETSSESRIYYFRPLRDGESVTYEFLHEPGLTMAHPSLERLAFLLEPGGVKLHWMTDATEDDWTGLKPDNALEAPEFSKVNGPLPLKPGEWNKASIRLENGVALLDLNGVRIYEYPLEPANQRIFGFFHDKSKTTAKIRDIVLRGPWPETVPNSLLARRNPNPTQPDRRARGAMIEERFHQLASSSVLAEARRMPPLEKYEHLLAYVVRNPDHVPFRLRGELAPTDPAPPVARYPSGEIESPALELIAAAKAVGKLDELADRVEKGKPPLDRIGRPNLAMLVLVRAAQGREVDAKEALDGLKPLLEKLADDSPEWMRWPELVAASATLDSPALRPSALALLEIMDRKWMSKSQFEWGKIVRPVLAKGRRLALEESRRPAIVHSKDGSSWAPVSHGRAISRGKGLPPVVWTYADGAWMHASGQYSDHLYLTTPLRGNFEVECELTSFGYRDAQLSYAALTVALEYTLKNYQLWQFGRTSPSLPIAPPIKEVKPWYAFKLAIKDGTYSAFVDGRKIHESRLSDEHDPWLSLASRADMNGGVRNLKITGQPVIPDSLNLSAGTELDGWLSDYYDDVPIWKKKGGEIVGHKLADPREPVDPNDSNPTAQSETALPGSKCETVLKYNRPMLEDGEITYEFFYEPGKVAVHPSLDRLAFLIEAEGLKIHWMTDAQYDRTGLTPENVTIEADRRRGPEKPPLKPGDWNKLKLALAGDIVTLTLNDAVVYERPLEPTNRRDFGLFRYADETEARVRNVNYRGQWPKTLPAGLLK